MPHFRHRKVATFAVLVMAVTSAILLIDIQYIISRTPQGSGTSFGASTLPTYIATQFNSPASTTLWAATGILLVITITGLYYLAVRTPNRFLHTQWQKTLHNYTTHTWAMSALLTSGSALIFAYTLGASSDYRLVFAIPVIASLLSLNPPRQNLIPTFIAVGLLAIMWLSSGNNDAHLIKNGIGLLVFPALTLLIVTVITRNIRQNLPPQLELPSTPTPPA